MAKTCPHCGAPVKQFQRECEYCGNELESRENHLEGEYYPIVPYGGRIVAEVKIPREYADYFIDDGKPTKACKEAILSRMRDEILEHIDVVFRVCAEDMLDNSFVAKGTLKLGAIPGREICPYSNSRPRYE